MSSNVDFEDENDYSKTIFICDFEDWSVIENDTLEFPEINLRIKDKDFVASKNPNKLIETDIFRKNKKRKNVENSPLF